MDKKMFQITKEIKYNKYKATLHVFRNINKFLVHFDCNELSILGASKGFLIKL